MMKKSIKVSAVGMLAMGLLLPLTGCQNFDQKDITCTVTDKDRSTATDKDGHSKSVFRVYTEECDTLGLADNLFAGNFNSSDMYGKIKVGKKYIFHVAGERNGALSWFPEIQKVTPVG